MQVSRRSTPRATESLAAQLDAHWMELARFITSRRIRSSVYTPGLGDLPAAQLYALGELARDDLRMTELAGRLGLAESTVTRVIDRLESAGLVARRTSPPDRRCVVAELTPTGRRLAAELEESRRQFLAELMGTLQPAERRELIRLFDKLTEAIRRRESAGKEERP